MANGTTAHQNIEAVKSTCNGLECSPSHHSPTSPIASGGSKATGKGVKARTGTLSSSGKTTRPKPHGTKTRGGSKSLMNQKSHGR